MKNRIEPRSIALSLGLFLTTLCQAQQGNLQGVASTPLSFKVPPHALSAISFSTAPDAQCSVASARDTGSGQSLTVYANDEGIATFYVTPPEESSSPAQLVATCSSGNPQRIDIEPVAGAKPLMAQATSNAATHLRLGHTVRAALTGDPMTLSNEELVSRGYPLRPDAQQSPGAYASWLKAVSKPATFIPPKTVNLEGRYHGPAKIAADTGGSTNWSGYVLLGPSNPFEYVQGDWNVPATVRGEEGFTYSTIWIGLDGWGSDNVVQDGTEEDVATLDGIPSRTYYPWKEICCQEPEVAFSNFSVHPGDEIYSVVWMGDADGRFDPWGGYGHFWFEDLTTGQFTSVSTRFNSGTFTGNSAEWIMERPTVGGSLPDLSDYWFAVMRDAVAYTVDNTWMNYFNGGDGATSTQLTMYNGNDALSTVYPIDSNTMEFVWMNYH